jgi:hypothetical protein
MPEENGRIGVFLGSRLIDHLSQVSRKLLILGRSCLDVGPGPAGFIDSLEKGHSSGLKAMAGS